MIMNQNEQHDRRLHVSLRSLRVVDLKEIIRSISLATGTWKGITGTKEILILRIIDVFSMFLEQRAYDKVEASISIVNRTAGSRHRHLHWVFHNGAIYNRPSLTADERARINPSNLYPEASTSPSSSAAPPAHSNATVVPIPTLPTVTYKSGPFYTVNHVLASPKVCEAAPFSRNSETFRFTLNEEQRGLLRSTDPEFQIRFCCASLPTPSTNSPLLLEFPPICEIKVNSHTIPAQAVRGLKNKPGTVNPPNITSMCSIEGANHVELVYANTGKKYVASIQFVRRIPIGALVKQMMENRFIAKDVVLEKYRQQQKDADIVLESETLSLKCPLAFTRIQLPCRSVMCKHAQCFDATTFLAMNEQTPTWSCPVCYRQIESFDDLIVDGFYSDILETFGTEVESVKIDSEGNIRLDDDTRPQPRVKQEEDTTLSIDSILVSEGPAVIHEQPSPLSAGGDLKQLLPPILPPLSSPSSPTSQPSSLQHLPQPSLPPLPLPQPAAAPPRKEVEVIDLTLDSDDD